MKTRETENYIIYEDGRVFNKNKQKFIKTYTSVIGYVRIRMDNKVVYLHRIIAENFCDGKSEIRNQVSHIDNDKSNNHASNLEWVTAKENIQKYHREKKEGMYDGYISDETLKAYQKRQQQREKYRQYHRDYAKRYYETHKHTEKYKEYNRKRSKEIYDKMRADPVKWSNYLTKLREKYWENKKKK